MCDGHQLRVVFQSHDCKCLGLELLEWIWIFGPLVFERVVCRPATEIANKVPEGQFIAHAGDRLLDDTELFGKRRKGSVGSFHQIENLGGPVRSQINGEKRVQ